MSNYPSIEQTISKELETENKYINLLIIEDEKGQIEQIEDAIEDYNRKGGEESNIKIQKQSVSTFEKAMFALLKDEFDAAIVDIQLDATTGSEDGVDLIEIILDRLRFPIFVRSGFPEKVVAISSEHNFVKVFKKTDRVDDIIEEIVKFHNKGITTTIGTKGKVEKYLNKIFWERLSKNFHMWDEDFLDNSDYEKSLVRYCLALLQEHLEIEENGGDFSDYHPFEVFICPPIKSKPFFGDILLDQDRNYHIILSPSCDMAQEKYEKIIIGQIEPLDMIESFTSHQQRYFKNESNTKKEKAKKKVVEFITNNHNDKYHYLPSYMKFPGGLINFQKIQSKTKEEIDKMERFASISGKFSKDIGARFSNYFARQGQPNLNISLLLNDLLDIDK
ncbi:hypothetical protein QL818_16805 [Bacillus altitudinis]|uniref:hypothetical protein n=1 Tax=Bacillus altitudinis TaxID=293387 RepID=UPI0024A8FE94|nr:hypothetical protein [Bacillus altitudinis]MDI6648882.1 hypothetical protein [Bacillus altitudinis]MDI6663344.1 hypothetical protein [Bacillus altitudinis]